MEARRKSFIQAIAVGQTRIQKSGLDSVAEVLQDFGRALTEFTSERIGVACVTRDGHAPVGGDFTPEVDMEIVLVAGRTLGTLMPIVASLRVGSNGFPARFGLPGEQEIDVADAGVLSDMLCRLGESPVFSSALNVLMESGVSIGLVRS